MDAPEPAKPRNQLFEIIAQLWHGCRHPGRLPRHWAWLYPVVILGSVAGLAWLLSTRDRWEWNRIFSEGKPGTYLSVAYLAVNGLVCLFIGWGLARRDGSAPGACRWLAVFMAGIATVVAGSIVLFVLGDVWHDRRHYYFNDRRLGDEFHRSIAGLVVLGGAVCWSLRSIRFTRFWLLFGSLLCWMALDDLLMFHEDFSDWLTKKVLGLPSEHLLTVHLNDVIVLLYGLLALWLAWGFRTQLVKLRWMILTMLPGVLCFAGTVVADFRHWGQWQEESLKVMAEAFILGSLLTGGLELRAMTPRRGSTQGDGAMHEQAPAHHNG